MTVGMMRTQSNEMQKQVNSKNDCAGPSIQLRLVHRRSERRTECSEYGTPYA